MLKKYESQPPEYDLPPKGMAVNREKRQHPRTEIPCPITIETDQGQIEGELRNISLGGLLIHSEALPDLGKPFKINIKIPNRSSLVSAKARAVRVNIQGGGNKPTTYIVAVRFVDISEDFIGILSQLPGL